MTTTNSEITWTTDDLTLERIERFFGGAWVQDILTLEREAALAFCASRARGAWNANERETHAAYKSLAKIIESR